MQSDHSVGDALQRFRAGADQLTSLLEGMDESMLDLALEQGAWSTRQIVHHLADDCDIYSNVVKRAIAAPGTPTRFEGFPGNEPWGDALRYAFRPVNSSLRLIQAHRQSMAELVAAVPGAFEKEATFIGEDGKSVKLNVECMLNMLSEHMDEHLQTIREIKKKHHIV